MNRSKNHILYEMYLSESGDDMVYIETKHLSLSHIVKYAELRNKLDINTSSAELVSLVTGGEKTIEDLTDKDFSLISSLKELASIEAELGLHYMGDTIHDAVKKIDEYHENKE